MQKNNVKSIRLRRHITIDRLVEITGIPKTTLHRIENGGSSKVLNKYRDKLAQAFSCSPEELDISSIDEGVPLVGEIKFKCYVKMLPKTKWKEVEFIEGLPKTVQAIRVIGNHLIPFHGKNDILYFDSNNEENPKLFIDRQCLVELPKGKLMIAWVSIGTKPNHYLLHQYGSHQIIIDKKIIKAHPVLYIKRG